MADEDEFSGHDALLKIGPRILARSGQSDTNPQALRHSDFGGNSSAMRLEDASRDRKSKA
jgi:hypothetical protein